MSEMYIYPYKSTPLIQSPGYHIEVSTSSGERRNHMGDTVLINDGLLEIKRFKDGIPIVVYRDWTSYRIIE